MSDLKTQTIKGLVWNSLGQYGNQIINVVVTMLLVRLLTPEDFGLIGIVLIFAGLSTLLINFGFGTSIVANKEVSDLELSSLFWLNLLIGVVLAALNILLSPVIASFFDDDRIILLNSFISLGFIFASLNVVQSALFRKELNFKVLTIRKTFAALVAGVIAIILAIYNYGVWSLAVQSVLISLLGTLVLWWSTKWRPTFHFSIEDIKSHISFSSAVFTNNVINYFTNNLDNLLIGKYVGKIELGYYSKAFSIVNLPVQNITKVGAQVLFPAFAKIQDNLEKLRYNYSKLMRVVYVVSFPLMLFIAIFNESFTTVIFGSKWNAIIPLVSIFAITGLISTLSLGGVIFLTLKKNKIILTLGVASKLIIITCLVVGLNYGLIGVAIGRLVGELIHRILVMIYINKSLEYSLLDQFSNMIKPFVIAAVSVCFSYLIVDFVSISALPTLFFIALSLSVLMYFVGTYFFNRNDYNQVLQIVQKALNRN